MTKLVLYIENYFAGGLERFVFDLINSKLFEIHIIVNSANTRVIEFAAYNNVALTVVELSKMNSHRFTTSKIAKKVFIRFDFIMYYFLIIPNYYKIKNILKNIHGYDNILIVNGGYPAALSCFSAAVAAKKLKFKKVGMSILSSPTPLYFNKIFKFIQSKIDNITDKYIDFYIPNSNKIKSELVNNLHFDSNKIHVVYTGVSLPKITDKLDSLKYNNIILNKENHDIWILMVGLLGSTKRQDLLIETMTKLDKYFKLLLLGDGPNRAIFAKKVQLLGLEDRVIFLGWSDKPEYAYRFSDIVVFLSDHEGLPYAISEAMSYKLPIIATSAGGIPEQVINNFGGLIVENDVNEIASSIKYIHNNPHLAKQFADYSFHRCKKIFSIDTMTHKISNLYK